MEITRELLHLDKWSLEQQNIMEVHTSFVWIIIFFGEALKCGDGAKFWGYVCQTLNHSEQNSVIFLQCHILVNYLTFWLSLRLRVPLNNF
jgi:hypothetical protein